MRTGYFTLIALTLPWSLGLVASAQAQQMPEPEWPSQLFARKSETWLPQTIVTSSLSAGTGDALVGAENAPAAEDVFHTGLQANLSHQRGGKASAFSVNVGTSVRFYPETREFLTLSRFGSLNFDTRLGRTGRFRFGQTAAYSPFRQFSPVFGGQVPIDGEFSSADVDGASTIGEKSYELGSRLDLGRSFGSRADLNFSYEHRTNQYPGSFESLRVQNAGVQFRYGLTPHAAFVLGTVTRMGRSGPEVTARPARAQDIDLGVDYNRALTFARNTKVRFTSGTTYVTREADLANGKVEQRSFLAIGSLGVSHSFGRNWEAEVSYDKNLRFIDGLPEPFYADNAMARIAGRKGRHLNFRAQVNYSNGRSIDTAPGAVEQTVRGFQSLARVGYGFSRNWQIFGEHYHTDNYLSEAAMASLPPGVIPRRFGGGMRVGVSLWFNHVH